MLIVGSGDFFLVSVKSWTRSKNYREMDKSFGAFFKTDELYSQLYQKHFKKTYAGKPTKRYQKIKKLINEADKLSIHEILNRMR